MKPFYKLSPEENDELLLLPVYVSLQAVGRQVNNNLVLRDAVNFSHSKTFSCDPSLITFYHEVDKNFEKNLIRIKDSLPKEETPRGLALEAELERFEKILSKLNEHELTIMQRSMESFKRHLSKSHNSVMADFIFPMPLPKLNI